MLDNICILQAVETFITVPQSSLLSYTAIGKSPTSDVTKAVPHSSVAYKVRHLRAPNTFLNLESCMDLIMNEVWRFQSLQALFNTTPMDIHLC